MGPLLIVGGADRIDQTDIYRAFLDNCTGGTEPSVAIIATATSDPEDAFEKIRAKLLSAGPCRAALLEISNQREEWKGGAFKREVLDLIESADGFWFTGGDQNMTIAALLEKDGSDTPALKAIREKNLRGAVIGGTSAGAAVMSDPMICGGETSSSLFSLFGSGKWDSDVALGKGLGFLKDILVDQHFDMRSRMGRLIAALHRSSFQYGLGISENTALLVKDGVFRVYGASSVFSVDMRDFSMVGRRARGIGISFFEKGDVFSADRGILDLRDKSPVGDRTVLSSLKPLSTGVFSPYADLRNFLARQLMDNDESMLESDAGRSSKYVTSYVFDPSLFPGESVFPALELRFHKTNGRTEAYADSRGGFAVVDVELEILSGNISFSP